MRLSLPLTALLIIPVLITTSTWCSADEAAQPKAKIPIGRETTYLESPLDAEGNVDYGAALNAECARGVTLENNACVALWRTVGPTADPTRDDVYYRALGIEPPEAVEHPAIDLEDFMKANPRYIKQLDKAYDWRKDLWQKPWTGAEYPIVAEWLAANEVPLAGVTEASKRSRYYSPIRMRDDVLGPGPFPVAASWFNHLSRIVAMRAMLFYGEGRHEDALDDLATCMRLGRLMQEDPSMLGGTWAILSEEFATTGLLQIVAEFAGTEADYRARLAELDRLALRVPFARRCDKIVRYEMLDQLQRIARGEAEAFDSEWAIPADSGLRIQDVVRMDFERALRRENRRFDTLVAELNKPDRRAREALVKKSLDEADAAVAHMRKGKAQLFGIPIPPRLPQTAQEIGDHLFVSRCRFAESYFRHEEYAELKFQSLRISLGLRIYRAKYGEYPERLTDLTDRLVMAVPTDPYAGTSFRYSRTAQGCLLYSIADNGVDDGGRTYADWEKEPKQSQSLHHWDDIVVRLSK